MSTQINVDATKQLNQFAMNVIANLKPCNNVTDLINPNPDKIDAQIKSSVLDRAIEAICMQNKIIATIAYMQDKDCFTTDRDGVVAILTSLLVGSDTSDNEEG